MCLLADADDSSPSPSLGPQPTQRSKGGEDGYASSHAAPVQMDWRRGSGGEVVLQHSLLLLGLWSWSLGPVPAGLEFGSQHAGKRQARRPSR